MNWWKRLRRVCLCGCVGVLALACLSVTAWAAEYPDTQQHWAREQIGRWSDYGVLTGYEDGTFGPDRPVTRAELSAILYKMRGMGPMQDHFEYPDVAPGDWYYDCLTTLNMYGIALNNGGYLYPDEALTREEAVYMIAKNFFIGQDRLAQGGLSQFSDRADIAERYTDRVAEMLEAHYVSGYPDGTFGPKLPITRAEVVTILDSVVDVYITQPGEYFIDNKQTALVNCGGDVIITSKSPAERYQSPKIYLMGEAVNGNVTFNHPFDGLTRGFTVCSVGLQEPQWETQGNCRAYVQQRIVQGTWAFPDTRFAGGAGKEYFPYIIRTAEQFQLLAEQTDDLPGRRYFQLAGDLDLGNWASPLGGEEDKMIAAHLDGAGHTITYRMSGDVGQAPMAGLFTTWRGSCSNLTLAGEVDISVSSLEGRDMFFFGGFCGYLQGQMRNCTSRMDITVRDKGELTFLEIGGLAGFVMDSSLTDCTASGSVRGVAEHQTHDMDVGGLVGVSPVLSGMHRGCQISGCGADGSVAAQGGYHSGAGGIVGAFTADEGQSDLIAFNYGLLDACWSTASVSASGATFQSDCGGLAGQINASVVQNSWAKPAVSNSGSSMQNIGSITGACYANGTITNCWGNAALIAAGGSLQSGGITGRLRDGTVSNCYILGNPGLERDSAIVNWNGGTITGCADLTGTDQADREQFYKSCGWDFDQVWDSSAPYPILRACDRQAQLSAQ